MSSIVPGFEYDIFISYRHNDNRSGWVTDFVNALQEELAATLKDSLTIYFDKNPHDGLLETHNVDKSLESKLKCLIFIPIISQTYCDPKSFAWQHEFVAFNKLAKEDQLGRDIKLSNGNVASRILPIKIHDLDAEDKTLVETEIGGVLRAIEFVFKSPGVNRPLRANEEHPHDNLNKTFYRDQINKVANAVKEIVSAMKKPVGKMVSQDRTPQRMEKQQPSYKKWATIAGLALLITSGIGYFLFQKTNQLRDPADSGLAILPFTNNTGSADLDFYGLGMASEVRTKLSMSKQFNFISSLQATMAYSKTSKTPMEIADELKVDYILSGLYQKAGDRIMVEAEFIDALTGKLIWSLPFEGELKDIFEVQKAIANEVLKRFSAVDNIPVNATTQNLEAYSLYLKGLELDNLSASMDSSKFQAISFIERAIAIDSLFSDPWVLLIELESFVYNNDSYSESRKEKLKKYTKYVSVHFPDTWQNDVAQGLYLYRVAKQFEQSKIFLEQALKKDPDNLIALTTLSALHKRKFDFAASIRYSKQVLNLYPTNASVWDNLSENLSNMGDINAAIKAELKSWEFNKSKTIANNLLNYAMSINNFEILPKEAKAMADNYPFIEKYSKREYESLKKLAYDSNNNYWKSLSWHQLGKYDSARHYALLSSGKGGEDALMDALAGDTTKAFSINDSWSKHQLISGEDKMVLAYSIGNSIGVDCAVKNYERATERLLQLNRTLPGFGGYHFFNHPFFDRIKKEYPPFNEALKNIKRQPMLNVEEYVKL